MPAAFTASKQSGQAQATVDTSSQKTDQETKADMAASSTSKASDEALTINIPNSTGGFTSVKLTKFKDGYKGPQGEFYKGHPSVDQLRALYGK